MGDRTTVGLYVLPEHVDQVNAVYSDDCPTVDYVKDLYDSTISWKDNDLVCFTFEEVNYGELENLPELLRLGIPFTSAWERGHEYTSGESTLRFDDNGRPVTRLLFEGHDSVCVESLERRLDEGEDIRDIIKQHKESIYVMPWNDQLRNSKLFLAKQLIDPTPDQP